MQRSVSMPSGDDVYPTPSSPHTPVWLRSLSILLLAPFATLIASTPSAFGQADNASAVSPSASPRAQICDQEKDSVTRPLVLGMSKTQPSNDGIGVPQQQSTSQPSSPWTSKDVDLPEANRSGYAMQDQAPICKKTKSPSEPGRSDDSLTKSGQASDPVAVSEVPIVSYVDGQLSINAENVPMGDVIEAIRVRTGIAVEFPSEPMKDPVFDHVGPAPLRDALTQLLYGSGFNYIIQTSSKAPQTVTKLVLSTQLRVASSDPPQHANQPLPNQPDIAELPANNEIPIQSTPVPSARQQGIPVGFDVQQAAKDSGKTPGQILDELQKRQQQLLDNQAPPQ
jgi:hypothetical protein